MGHRIEDDPRRLREPQNGAPTPTPGPSPQEGGERLAPRANESLGIVAGIGFRHGCAAAEIAALVTRALGEAGLPPARLLALATLAERADDVPLREAAAFLAVPVIAVAPEALRHADAGVATRSARVEALHGVGSVAEAAALAASGADGLALARVASAGATCALAVRESPR